MANTRLTPLPPSVEQLITRICTEQNKPPLGAVARECLASVGEEAALTILREIVNTEIKKSFDGFVRYLVNNNGSSPTKRICLSPPSPLLQKPSLSPTPTRLMMHTICEPVFKYPTPMGLENSFDSVSTSGVEISPQLEALGELEFRKAFIILSYKGGYRLEDIISADDIRGMKYLPMDKFEIEVWKSIGCKCDYIKDNERVKYFVSNCSRTHIYHCHVYPNGALRFKGPYLTSKSNFLQRTLGDDNILMLKFAEEVVVEGSSTNSSIDYYDKYMKLARVGILVGLRCYRFFVFKDGGKEKKKRDPSTSPVKCFFVRMESNASSDASDYILNGKTIREARSVFMNVDKLSNLSKYMARFSLILSNTMNLDVNISSVKIETINDILCLDKDRNVIKDKDGKFRIHTDGTGFISQDLAFRCPRNVFKGKSNLEDLLDFTEFRKVSKTKSPESHFGEPPLLMQFRLFNNGGAYKGTLLVNKKLPSGTIQVRPSMIKVEPDSEPKTCSKNSMEIVGTSNRPKMADLSRYLIALLNYGGVPEQFFMDLLNNALEETRGALSKKHAALRVAILHGEMDDYTVAKMLLSGIPLEESYIQHHLHILMKDEKKSLKGGHIPVPESYYLMGTVDPTGTLASDEVCIIMDNGHVSGEVLVYRNPGLHFGDIHVLKAKYVKDLEDYVGNSKYAIFFPVKGPRSLADEMGGGDFDGDVYFVSRNPELLKRYNPSGPWTSMSSTNDAVNRRPDEFSDIELEDELFKLFLTTRFQPSYTMVAAAESWLALMDRLLTLGDNRNERHEMKRNMYELVDKYYDALDAPKNGKKIYMPEELKAELFPHYMGKKEEISYKSTSVLGLIYDKVKSYEEEDISDNVVWKLPCFNDKVSDLCIMKWQELYDEYRQDMVTALKCKETKDEAAKEVYKKYKEILYEAAEFEESKKKEDDIFEEALAIYEVTYNYAKTKQAVNYCSFAWKIAGQALCKLYSLKQGNGSRQMTIYTTPSSLKELLT